MTATANVKCAKDLTAEPVADDSGGTAKETRKVALGMENQTDLYGPLVYRLSLQEAIEKKIHINTIHHDLWMSYASVEVYDQLCKASEYTVKINR